MKPKFKVGDIDEFMIKFFGYLTIAILVLVIFIAIYELFKIKKYPVNKTPCECVSYKQENGERV